MSNTREAAKVGAGETNMKQNERKSPDFGQISSIWRAAAGAMGLALLVSGCASPSLQRASGDLKSSAAEASVRERLIVTIELGSSGPLRGAGSTEDDYFSDAGGYDVPERTLRIAGGLARDHDLVRLNEWPIDLLDLHCVVFGIPDNRSVDEVIEQLQADARVESAQPMRRFRTLGSTNRSTQRRSASPATQDGYDDPYLELQHGLAAMRVQEAHRWADGRGVRIAVVDTAVDRRHDDLKPRIATYSDFVESRPRRSPAEHHGTAVAGIIASVADNGFGTVGVAPGATIDAIRACWEAGSTSDRGPDAATGQGECDSFTLAQALAHAADRRADIVNVSLTGPRDPLLERLTAALVSRGSIVVAAASDDERVGFLEAVEGVLFVESDGDLPAGASLVMAPGENVLAPTPGNAFDFVSGSSFAAAHISGLIALLLQHEPDADPERIARILTASVRETPAGGGRPTQRTVDACAALEHVVLGMRCDAGDTMASTPTR